MMGGYGTNSGFGSSMMLGGWVGGLLLLIFGTLILVGVVLLIVWAVRASGGHSPADQHTGVGRQDEALTIAKRRFASGEITKEQYDEIVQTLM